MKKGKKTMAVMLSLVMAAAVFPAETQAASKKITTVSIEVENEIMAGFDYSVDDIEVTAKSNQYSVGNVDILNDDNDGIWKNTDIPRISVTLDAADGYYFSVAKDNVKIKGGTYVSGKREGSYALVVTVDLPSLLENVGEIDMAWWESNHEGGWSPAENAGCYEVRLYRDGKVVGSAQKVSEPKIDFGSRMRKEGNYTFRVRAVNVKKEENKTEWREAETVTYIDSAAAENMRARYGNEIPSYLTEPGQMLDGSQARDGWNRDDRGWWYRNGDGSYTVNNWQEIDGKWYYFNSDGYMVTGWIDWQGKSYYCDPVNGDMQVDKVIPDGSGRRVDTTGAWIE